MELQTCPRCGVRVVATSEATCPSCRRSFQEPLIVATHEQDPKTTRIATLLWALLCPGVGFANLGYRRMALLQYLANVGTLLLCGWLLFAPGLQITCTVAVMFAAILLLSLAELLVVWRARQRCTASSFLTWRQWVAAAVLWCGGIVVLVGLVTGYRSFIIAADGMSPTVLKGERILAARKVKADHLRNGSPIVFKNSAKSAWGKPGWIVVARILAVPGDKLYIQDGSYHVNGASRAPAESATRRPMALEIPQSPSVIEVPRGCYFVVQDKPEAFDSRTLSWAHEGNIISTELYLMNWRRLLEKLE